MQKLTFSKGETAANGVFQGLYFIGSNTIRRYTVTDLFLPQHSSEAREIETQKSLMACSTARVKSLMFLYYGSIRF